MGREKSMFWFDLYRKEAQKIEKEGQKIKQIIKKHINNQKEMIMLIFMVIININVFLYYSALLFTKILNHVWILL